MADQIPFRPVRTLTVPDAQLLRELDPLPEGITAAVWDLAGEPDGVDAADVDAVVLPYAPAGNWGPALARAPRLQLVQTQTTGYDGVPELIGPQTAVATAAGVHAAATAELAVGLMIASLRGIPEAVRSQERQAWEPARWPGLADRRVLLLGVGGIGREIAARLKPFDVELTRVGSRARTDKDGQVHGPAELTALARTAEVLVIITPLNPDTRHLVDAEVLAALPDGALVVNVARGPVVDTAALTREVVSGRLRAALDVVDPEPLPSGHPLWSAPNALITPHNGGNSGAFPPRIAALLRRQAARLAAGREPENLVIPGPWARGGR
ncbi:Phosphonate dehydrogenase [Arthrobacter saudimassiliensis]|uniref:Phosphonate dehydrogenase n=1 Tax=Arthrobacter saudimassiliensis TaxID=1461584 RepID=A0A078MQF0_9MICC|nr:Phosphonate dehydrogenase [Arthrobacter saudimassiliensis]